MLACAARALIRDLVSVCYFPAPRFYELAGLTPGTAWRRRALRNPARRAFIAQCLDPTRRMLGSLGLNIGP